MKKCFRLFSVSSALLSLLLLASCTAKEPFYGVKQLNWTVFQPDSANEIVHTVYLVGDAGNPEHGTGKMVPSLKYLESDLKKADESSTIVFLGDNIYPIGLPERSHPDRDEAEKRINYQLDIVQDFKGRVMFVPGNHDWNMSQKGGLEAVRREEAYIEKYLGRGNTFFPDLGCPGPSEIEVSDKFVILAIDSEWWLHKHEKPTENPCGIEGKIGFTRNLMDAMARHDDKTVLAVAHHPLFTNGNHGGYFPWTFYAGVITAIYPLGRKMGASRQDLSNRHYQSYKNVLLQVFSRHERLIYAAGHEHSLQYWQEQGNHFLVSGAGCKSSHCAKGHGAQFAHQAEGFMKINYYANDEVWMEVWEPMGRGEMGILVYRKRLFL